MAKPRAWVHATVWRLLANRRRSQRAGPLAAMGGEATTETAELECRLEIRLEFASAARRLTEHERRLLRLLALGHSHHEIAENLGIGWKSVGARVQRLRGKLRRLLEQPPKR